jgi:organic hydroperoxide reductase OsmC/OhrA
MPKTHRYAVTVAWTGNTGAGTSDYRSYERRHEISTGALKPVIPGSSDPAFRGDPSRWNPEELLVASLSACHQLWYLHLCADAGIVVVGYVDRAEGLLREDADGSGRFERVILRPEVAVAPGSDLSKARELHALAHAKCFIASSVNFPVEHEPEIETAAESDPV